MKKGMDLSSKPLNRRIPYVNTCKMRYPHAPVSQATSSSSSSKLSFLFLVCWCSFFLARATLLSGVTGDAQAIPRLKFKYSISPAGANCRCLQAARIEKNHFTCSNSCPWLYLYGTRKLLVRVPNQFFCEFLIDPKP
jgi:hypothetical protein